MKLFYVSIHDKQYTHLHAKNIPGVNKQLFKSKKRANSGNSERPNNESDTSAAGLILAIPSTDVEGSCC